VVMEEGEGRHSLCKRGQGLIVSRFQSLSSFLSFGTSRMSEKVSKATSSRPEGFKREGREMERRGFYIGGVCMAGRLPVFRF
jgi:hypothetical protein